MSELVNRNCEACRVGAPRATEAEIREYLPLIPDWQVLEEEGVQKLMRRFPTASYAGTVRLANAVADLAESEGHHPVILLEFAAVTVWWWTHKIGGLHVNDFVMAAKTDRVARAAR